MARFYLNENIDVDLARLLGEGGHDVETTVRARHLGASDISQLDYAVRENRIIVTHNRKDFRRLHFRFQSEHRDHPGIILLRIAEPEVLRERVERLLAREGLPERNFCERAT